MISTIEMTTDHIIGYGVRIDGDNIAVRIQWHPEIQKWLKENRIVPEYKALENVPGYRLRISGFEKPGDAIKFKESELKNSRFDVEELLSKVQISATMAKKQAKFMFPVFRKTPVLTK